MIRRATTADAPAIAPLSLALMGHERIAAPPAFADGLARLLGDPELGFVMMAERAGAAIGHAICTFGYDLEFAGRDAFLTELYVDDGHRADGVGAQLLAAVEREAIAQGVRALHLQVRADNRARRLYDRAGFTEVPRLTLTKRLDSRTR